MLKRPLTPVAKSLERGDMRMLGIDRTARIARGFNWRRRRLVEGRRRLFRNRFEELLAENGWTGGAPRPQLEDGYALDESESLPHTRALVSEMEQVIAERGGRKWEDLGKEFLQNILPPDAAWKYPSLVDFGTSSEVLEPVCGAFGYIPHLSTSLPRGIRLQESSLDFDPAPGPPWRDSQFWHRDYHTDPTVYVITIIRDIDETCGPLHYLGAEASRRVTDALGYRHRGVEYRLTDERVNEIVEPDEIKVLTGSPGTTLIIDSSLCFHYGSRNPVNRRYQVQYAYANPVKNDFSEVLRQTVGYPVDEAGPALRRLLCDRDWLPAGA